MPLSNRTVELREVLSETDWDRVMRVRLAPGQDRYINPIDDIRLEASEQARAMPRAWAVHDMETGDLVGFTMISDNIPEPMDEDLLGPYYLWKLLIDRGRQRQGWGRATLDAVIAYVRSRPNARVLLTSCGMGDGSPYPFYVGYGFVDTGRDMWGERVLAFALEAAITLQAPVSAKTKRLPRREPLSTRRG